jgi:hypothetical protein
MPAGVVACDKLDGIDERIDGIALAGQRCACSEAEGLVPMRLVQMLLVKGLW